MSASLRQSVVERDDHECQECGVSLTLDEYDEGPTAHVHHIVPKSEGGSDAEENLVTLCPSCHADRHPRHGIGVDLKDDDLREVDEQLLDYLEDGRITPAYARLRLKDDVDEYSRGYVQQRLSRLEEHQHVENLYDVGLYELVEDPRGEADE